MEIKKITWEDKVAIEDLNDIEEINKVTAANINEIKDVINNNGDFTLEEITRLDELINTKQDTLNAGDGITINDKLISINNDLLIKWNGYESSIQTNQNNIQINQNSINKNQNDIQTLTNSANNKFNEVDTTLTALNQTITSNASAIANLETKHTQQQSAIDTNTANISSLNTSIAGIRNDINDINTSLNETNQKVNTKQDIITAGNGLQLLNNLISIQEQLLNKWNGYQTLIQTNQGDIATNTNEISTLQNDVNGISKLIQQIIEGLRQFPVFEIVGDWVSGTTYRKNQAVYHNNKLWNSKIDNNNSEPDESNTDWFLISKFDIDLSNYVTQNDLTNALRLKQDVLTGTGGIIISQATNEIAIDNNLLTKWNGYENLIQANQTNIGSIQNKADANESEINRINGIVTTNTTNITNLQNNAVLKNITTPQTIASQITFTGTDQVLKFNSGTNNSAYLAGYKSNNQRVWYFGKGSSTSDNFIIGADNGVIKLEPSTHVDVSNKKIINVAAPTAINDAVNKQYVDNNTLSKTSTTIQTVAGPVSFTQPLTVPTPTADTNAATKAYVDNAIQNITPGSGGSIDTSNFATLNTAQTITGAKTFDNQVIIRKDGTPLILRAVAPGKIYMLMKGADDATNFSLGANSSNTSLEVNRGDLTFQTVEANKNVNFVNVARVKLNRSVLETGTEINAGFGGLNVKFIPEDNSTKTLQFYNANPNDTRRFKLLVPEPTEAQNPATKNYVDNAIANNGGGGAVNQDVLNQINANRTEIARVDGIVNNNSTNIVDLGNRTTNLENNYLKKNGTGLQQVSGNVDFLGDLTIKHNGYIDVVDSAANTSITNVQYVKGLDAANVKLTTDQTINGTKTFTNQIVANGGLKTASGQTITSGNLELGFGATFAYITPENGDAKALKFSGKDGRGKFDLDMGGASKITNLPEPINDQDAATKQYVDTAIANSGGSGGSIPQQTLDQINTNKTNIADLQSKVNVNTNNINSNYTNLNTLINRTNTIERNYLNKNETNIEQVIAGPVTFRQRVSVPTTPRSANDVTNKTYVDNLISQIPNGGYTVIFSNLNTFNNLNTLSPINISSNTTANKPWIIQFDRNGNNGNTYEGTINYNFLLPDINQAIFADCTTYYNSSNKRFDSGARAGITILRTGATTLQFTFQLWDRGNRISNIKLFAPK